MHEMSIAEGLIEQVLQVAQEHHLLQVDEVMIQSGELRLVIPEVMQEAFRAVTLGTIAEHAVLKIEEVSAEAVCNQCGKVFHPQINDFLCPVCFKADTTIQKGEEIILASVISYEGQKEGKT